MVRALVLCMAVFGFGLSQARAADEIKVRVTTFHYAGDTGNRAAEICGKVTGTRPALSGVRVTVDPQSGDPGIYTVVVGDDGNFCTMVLTYRGRAEVAYWAPGAPHQSASIIVTAQQNTDHR